MKDSPPTSADEYRVRFHRNHRVEGYGMETTTVAPCPFCAAPDWQKWPIVTVAEAVGKEATCRECGRSAKALVKRDAHGVSFEFVQTGGPDQPEWLTPKMRRIDLA